ncbi:MAG: GntP family permease, partial [Bacteroidetes bacterium]
EVIKAMDIGTALGAAFSQSHLGLLIPFALAVIFKTAQGSSTVAVISAAGITEPLLAALGLDSEMGRLFTLMALGSGSMMVSHANDAYFWVISRFGHISSPTLLRVYSTAGSVMGIVSFVCLSLAYALFSLQ